MGIQLSPAYGYFRGIWGVTTHTLSCVRKILQVIQRYQGNVFRGMDHAIALIPCKEIVNFPLAIYDVCNGVKKTDKLHRIGDQAGAAMAGFALVQSIGSVFGSSFALTGVVGAITGHSAAQLIGSASGVIGVALAIIGSLRETIALGLLIGFRARILGSERGSYASLSQCAATKRGRAELLRVTNKETVGLIKKGSLTEKAAVLRFKTLVLRRIIVTGCSVLCAVATLAAVTAFMCGLCGPLVAVGLLAALLIAKITLVVYNKFYL